MEKQKTNQIEVQGHRGDRGNFPENSIPAFLSAVHKGVDVLELDVVVSQDRKIVVSHEPFMSSDYIIMPDQRPVTREEEEQLNLYQMDYEKIRKFDAGSRGNKRFPQQRKMQTHKPLLEEVFDSVENHIRSGNLRPVEYNIELKSVASEYGISQPVPEEFVDLVMQVISDRGVEDKVNIQSFDPTIVNIFRARYPDVPLAFLVESGGIAENLDRLNFKPEIYSPHFSLLDKETIDTLKVLNMRVIPWTVNEAEDIKHMIHLGVDGIISDYPERVLELLEE